MGLGQFFRNPLWGILPDLATALAAVKLGHLGEQELHVLGKLGQGGYR